MDSFEHLCTVEDLAEFMRISKDDKNPFIFITGAGCSVTAGIPLAKKIVSELNEQFPLQLKPLSDEDRKDYGKCMARLEISKRRKYLQDYIGKAKINWAHIALACLMKEGYIRRVMTFNFDNLLARSCGLLGEYPPIYDFTAANLNLHRLIDDPAIVHLHGQGHGFVQLNTDSETEEHAKRLKDFVGHILSESPTLFIGYSGNSDAFLPQIEAQFDDQHRLFWVDMNEEVPEHLQKNLLTSRLAHYMSCKNGADLFLIELAQELDCFPPTIFADPYQHLLDELEEVTDYPVLKGDSLDDTKESQLTQSDSTTQDILLETKNRLREVQRQDKDSTTQDILLETKNRLRESQRQDKERGRDFLQEYLQGDYQKIIKMLEKGVSLNYEQSLWLARSYFNLASRESIKLEKISIYDRLIERFKVNTDLEIQELVAKALINKGVTFIKLEQFERAIDVYDELLAKFSENKESVLQEHVAKALINKGIVLGKLGQVDKEVKVYDKLIVKFGEIEKLVLQEQVAIALINKGIALGELKQFEQAVKAYDELTTKFCKSEELALQELVVKALVNKGAMLGVLQEHEKAIDLYNELISKFGESEELVLQEQVAKALINKGIALGKLDKVDQEVNIYNELISKFGESEALVLQEQIAKALVNKGATLGKLKHFEQAVKAYDELINKSCESEALVLQEQVARALVNKGATLGDLKQFEQAVECYDELITKFDESDVLILQERVADAYNGLGYSKLMMAKQHWQNTDVAQNYLNKASNDFSKALEKSSKNRHDMILANIAYIKFLQGNISESEKYLREALKQGQQHLYNETIKDIERYPIDLDKEFKRSLDRVWFEVK